MARSNVRNTTELLVKQLEDADPALRKAAADELAFALAEPAQRTAIISALTSVLTQDKVPDVRAAASWALMEIGDQTGLALPSLCHALFDSFRTVRYYAALSLYNLGSRVMDALPALFEALDDPDAEVRRLVAEAILQVQPSDLEAYWSHQPQRPSVPLRTLYPNFADLTSCRNERTLLNAFQGSDTVLRHVAAIASRWVGISETLVSEAVSHRDDVLRHLLVIVFRSIPVAPSLLVPFLQDQCDDVRYEAARSFGLLPPPCAVAISQLVECLKDKNPAIRRQAATSLGHIGGVEPEAKSAYLPLVCTLMDDAPDVSQRAAEALMAIGDPLDQDMGVIINRLESQHAGASIDGDRVFYIGEIRRVLEKAEQRRDCQGSRGSHDKS